MDAGWADWWPSVLVFLVGLVILIALAAVVGGRLTRTRREFSRCIGSVRRSVARLRASDLYARTARSRSTGFGRG